MRKLALISAAAAAIVFSAVIATCGDPSSHLPTSPSAPGIAGVEISGPASVAPGQSAQFTVLIRLSDGTRKAPSAGMPVRWSSLNSSILRINDAGLATATQVMGDAVLSVQVNITPASVQRSTKEVVILPDGTYRVVGVVSDAAFSTVPLAGARVEVTPGSPFTTTDLQGAYRLYGVAPDVQIRVTRDGYQPFIQSLHLSANATQNFQLALSGPRLQLAGPFTLAIDVTGTCSGTLALSADLLHRRYDAVITQSGPALDVALTESRFRVNSTGRGNHFGGQAAGGSATFTLDDYGYYYYAYYGPLTYPNVAERLSNGTFLVVAGTVVTIGSASGLSGQMSNASLGNWDSRFPTVGFFLGGCSFGTGSTLQFTLSPR